MHYKYEDKSDNSCRSVINTLIYYIAVLLPFTVLSTLTYIYLYVGYQNQGVTQYCKII